MSITGHNNTNPNHYRRWAKASRSARAKLLICHPEAALQMENVQVLQESLTVGRSGENNISFGDKSLSETHLRISRFRDYHYIVDLQSKNGTAVNGTLLRKKQRQRLQSGDVISAGHCLFVYHASATCTQIPSDQRHGLVGDFHGGDILLNLRRAVLSPLHILLMGPPGSGKDHAAQTVASYLQEELHYTDCATTSPKKILAEIKKATGKLLYVDNASCLPMSYQHSLAHLLARGKFSPANKSAKDQSASRFILSSTESKPGQELSESLQKNLRVVNLPSLRERAADVPALFRFFVRKFMLGLNLQPEFILNNIPASHYESLCIDGFPGDNIHGLVRIAESIATDVAIGISASEAIGLNLERRESFLKIERRYRYLAKREQQAKALGTKRKRVSPGTPAGKKCSATKKTNYEKSKHIIEQAYHQAGGNISKTKRILESQGYRVDRWTLNKYIKQIWSLPSRKNRSDQGVG